MPTYWLEMESRGEENRPEEWKLLRAWSAYEMGFRSRLRLDGMSSVVWEHQVWSGALWPRTLLCEMGNGPWVKRARLGTPWVRTQLGSTRIEPFVWWTEFTCTSAGRAYWRRSSPPQKEGSPP